MEYPDVSGQKLIHCVKTLISKKGMTVREFAIRYLVDTVERDLSEDEILSFYEKCKKHLQRPNPGPKVTSQLKHYLTYLSQGDEAEFWLSELLEVSDERAYEVLDDYEQSTIGHAPSLAERQQEDIKPELEVAMGYAASIGQGWTFFSIEIPILDCHERSRHLVFWHGHLGHPGGSGAWGIMSCEVYQCRFSTYSVDTETLKRHWLGNMKMIEQVRPAEDSTILVCGLEYIEGDCNNSPTGKIQVLVTRDIKGHWSASPHQRETA